MKVDKSRVLAAYHGGTVTITLHPTPSERTQRVEEDLPTYETTDGKVTTERTNKRARRHVRNEDGQLMYTDAEGDTVQATDRFGVGNEPKMETYTQHVVRTETVYEEDGVTPRMDYATISARLRFIDTKGRTDGPDTDTFSEDELTEDQKDRLIAIWGEVLAQRAAVNEIYPTPAAAKEAGVITE